MTGRGADRGAQRQADEQRWSAWLVRAQAGDRQAYESLLSELIPVIRAYLQARFGHLEIVDDCVQESLLAVHQARHSYDPNRPFRPWLFTIVRHRTIDQLRKLPRQERPRDGHAERPPGALPDSPGLPDPALGVDGGRMLARLSHRLRDALLLTRLYGFSTRECAAHLGVSETVVKVRVHRGLRQLRHLWEAESR